MSAAAPFGGDILIADTSVWRRADRFEEPLKEDWATALANGQIATTPVVVFELLYFARFDRDRYDRWRAGLTAIRRFLVPDRSAWSLAYEAYVELIDKSELSGMSLTDILNAAIAMRNGFPVLHVDKDYARLERLNCLDFKERRLDVS